jgi:hypothetical protein
MRVSLLLFYLSLLYFLFFDLWVEHSEQAQNFFGNWIDPFIDEPKFSLVWTIILISGLVAVFQKILDSKEQEKEELERTLDSEMAILVMANKELNSYRLQDNLTTILNKFVQRHPYVSAAQWYQYSENNHHGHTNFKLNFLHGTVEEDINLNAIQQLYLSCDAATLREFRKAKRLYTENKDPDQLVDFIIDAHHDLSTKPGESLTKEDAVLCSLMLLAFELLQMRYDLVFEDFLESSEEKYQKLMDSNRTGLLRAALVEDEAYSFTHTRDNEKFNRLYIASLVKLRRGSYIATIALDSSILEDEDYDDIIESIKDEYEELLKELEKMYTRSNKREGD